MYIVDKYIQKSLRTTNYNTIRDYLEVLTIKYKKRNSVNAIRCKNKNYEHKI